MPSHSGASSIRKDLKRIAGDYIVAISMSVQMAEHGFTYAGEAVRLCKYLIQEPDDDVHVVIGEMRRIVRQALGEAKDTTEKFSTVRRQFCHVRVQIRFLLEL